MLRRVGRPQVLESLEMILQLSKDTNTNVRKLRIAMDCIQGEDFKILDEMIS